ncbi:LOW QUALITY PROTEIN: box C/D snoRNA protein 1-like [Daphnia carinata]|uniref:LOW QUALITY PROTEIN: box C/D snoRNA protein 1-like n=1 Tax=Daphnia carinata TaxID=120202 RepID=UPI00257CD814|nr:LOW QUALITY PROTEIN: box C/D snoRNA protein 1-like [Daphnia carinata]
MEVVIKRELTEDALKNRLGTCEKCGAHEARYTCPRCEFRSCCLQCVNLHKKEFDCNGIRDKTRFKSVSQFTELDLLSDYRLLEEAGRSVEAYNRDVSKRNTRMNKELPTHLHRLRCAAAQRGITLRFLPPNFTRHKFNTTYLDWKSKKIDWKVEWKFTWLDVNTVENRVSENDSLQNVFEKTIESKPKYLSLSEADVKNVHIFLPAEHSPGQNGRFHQISLDKTLSDNLKGTVIVEHPIFHVVLDPQDRYPLVGTPLRVREPRAKCKKEPSPHGDNDADESSGKKQKLTFFDVSDGEEQSD